MYSSYTDMELFAAIQQDDEKAFAELFKRYWSKAHIITYSKVRSKEVTEEIVQDIFMTLWDKRTTLVINNVSSYIFTAVKNKSINYIESCLVKQKYWDYYKTFIPQSESTTQYEVDYNALLDAIENGLHNLPEKSKKVFQLNRLEGRSITEIANILNLSEKAIEYHLTRSIKQLKMYLKDFVLILTFYFLY